MSKPFGFVAYWPITDQSVPYEQLLATARDDIPLLAARARARLIGPGRFSIARSQDVPGSGRITPTVLVYEAPARPMKPRAYHARSAA